MENNVISEPLILHMCLGPRSIPWLAMRKLLILELWTICAFRWPRVSLPCRRQDDIENEIACHCAQCPDMRWSFDIRPSSYLSSQEVHCRTCFFKKN